MSGLDKNRFRNQTICFRMSLEERQQMYARIKVSGMPKGQYIIQSVLNQQISITAGKYQSDRLALELRRLRERMDHVKSEVQTENLLQECKALLEQLQILVLWE